MYKKYLLSIYLNSYQIYCFVWKLLFSYIGSLPLIYFVNNNKIVNITPYYYIGYGLRKYNNGKYFCRILNKNQSNYITHNGSLTDLKMDIPDQPTNLKRKNITLLDNGNVVSFDLNILDNYVHNMQKLNNTIESPDTVFKCLGIQCTHVQILTIVPFKKTVLPISEITITDLYEKIE